MNPVFMMKIKRFAPYILFWSLLFLGGCAGVRLSKEDRAAIRTVSVDRDVLARPDYYMFPRRVEIARLSPDTQRLFGLRPSSARRPGPKTVKQCFTEKSGSPILCIIFERNASWEVPRNVSPELRAHWYSDGDADSKAMCEYVIRTHGIRVGQIFREAFASAFREAGLFGGVVEEGTDAVFQFTLDYGFGLKHGMSRIYKPMIMAEGTLVTPDGRVVWQGRDFITNVNTDTPGHTMEEYLNQPELISRAFASASEILARAFIDALRQ